MTAVPAYRRASECYNHMGTLAHTTRVTLSSAVWRKLRLSAATVATRCASFSTEEGTDGLTPARRAWSKPAILNPLSGRLDSLLEPSTGSLKWYSCGPTVYDSAHLGHARTYVSLDIIRRILVDHFHFDVIYALGITDVDDKIITRAREQGLKSWPDIASMAGKIEKEFMRDMDDLGVRRPDAVVRVTDHLPDIIAYIERIIENGMAYEAEGGIYFDVEKMGSNYGKLGVGASDSTTPTEEGVEDDESDLRGKRSHKDFALWKEAKPDEPWWDSPFGRGRPGWHIECSAMTHSLFGQHLDLHSGGVDLKFPHHTNEIAQCEAYGCGAAITTAPQGDASAGDNPGESKPWVGHWIHTGHLHIEGRKMSKSLKNFVTIKEYLDGHSGGKEAAAEDFRMFCLLHKYSSSVTFSEDRLEEARIIRGRMERFLGLTDMTLRGATSEVSELSRRWGDKEKWLLGEISACRRNVHLALSEDFDTSRAVRHLASLCALISMHINSGSMGDVGPVRAAAKYVSDTLGMLGIGSGRSNAVVSQGIGERLWDDVPGHDGGGGGGATGALPSTREAISAIVELRRAMRQLVLAQNLSSPKCVESAKQMKRDLLELADRTRDETLRNMGIHVDDGPKYTCTWMLLPPQSRQGGSASPGRRAGLPAEPDRTYGDSTVDSSAVDGDSKVPPRLIGAEKQEEANQERQ